MTDEELIEELSEMGRHPCRAHLPMGETLRQAASRIEALTAENFKLAAGSCDVEGGKVGDERGHFYCTLQKKVEAQAAEISKWHTVTRAYLDRIETLRAYNERLNKSAECLAETRRLAVKDLAALEAEIERLHRALLDVIECDPGAYEATIARAALEQSK
jgi:hypothetical protein